MRSTIQDNLQSLSAAVHRYESHYQRLPHSVSLLAVSKGQSLEKVQQAIAAGQRLFGENYLQEALLKIAALKKYELEWHFIGNIQRNKTRALAENFAWVHTVANGNIAERLHDQRPPELPPLNICLEVNVSQEKSKSGLMEWQEILALTKYCQSLPRLHLRGLMTIPAYTPERTVQRQEFQKLFLLKKRLEDQGFSLDTLSMGMTLDFEAAIAEGATIIRIGRGIFGERSLGR